LKGAGPDATRGCPGYSPAAHERGGRGLDGISRMRATLANRQVSKSRPALHRLLAGATLLLAGCGYSTDREKVIRTTNSKNERIHTIALDVFASREFRRGLELQLTEALAKRLEAETPFKLAKKDRADTIMTGEIREVRQSTIGRDFRTVQPRETTDSVVVSFQWKDLRTGEVLLDRPNYVQTVDYVRFLGEDFYHASGRAMDRLSERIIEEMQTTDW
jgi:hypothetical protein